MGLNDQIATGRLPIRRGEKRTPPGTVHSAATLRTARRRCLSGPMAERRVLPDDARMVWMAELPMPRVTPRRRDRSKGIVRIRDERRARPRSV
jgi:hypothetical protein